MLSKDMWTLLRLSVVADLVVDILERGPLKLSHYNNQGAFFFFCYLFI